MLQLLVFIQVIVLVRYAHPSFMPFQLVNPRSRGKCHNIQTTVFTPLKRFHHISKFLYNKVQTNLKKRKSAHLLCLKNCCDILNEFNNICSHENRIKNYKHQTLAFKEER